MTAREGKMRESICASAQDVVTAAKFLLEKESIDFMDDVSSMMLSCYKNGHKILIAGNGGSLCDAMHFAEELTGFYREKRRAFAAIALSDPGHMSCVGNDIGFQYVFSRALEALGNPGDLFICLTTSGKSSNLLEAMRVAKERGLKTIAFLGKGGGLLKGVADLEWVIPGFKYSDRIQEAHMAAIHIIIETLEKKWHAEELAENSSYAGMHL